MKFNYILKKSKRKTVAIKFKNDGNIEIAAPLFFKKTDCEKLIHENENMIEKKIEKIRLSYENSKIANLSENEIENYKNRAKEYFVKRTELICNYLHNKNIFFEYKKINITSAKNSWGSCSYRKGESSLNFSWRLMALCDYDYNLADYVIVHELCHTIHHNHSNDFWNMVELIIPDYRNCKSKIKRYAKENINLFN